VHKRIVALGLVAVFVVPAVAGLVLAVTGGNDGGDGPAGPKATATTDLTDTAQELIDRLSAARKRPLHLVYTGDLVASPDAGELTVEIWWMGDLARQDVKADAPQLQQQSSFVLPSGNVTCAKAGTAEWSCQRSAPVATASGKPEGIIESLVAQLKGRKVTKAKAAVGGTDVDCYTLDTTAGDIVCLRDDGVPVRFTLSGSELLATSIATDVDDGDFTLPAEPTELPATPTTPTTGR